MWLPGVGRVRLSKSEKNIGAGGWWVDNVFEAVYSGDILANPRITSVHTPLSWIKCFYS